MASTVQLNTRIDPGLKARGDAVFARAGLSSSEVVRAVWETAARTQEVPACVVAHDDAARQSRIESIRAGAGLARRMAGVAESASSSQPLDYKQLRDESYDELVDEMAARHA